MTDTYTQLKDELSVLYPDVTDAELNEATFNLNRLFTLGIKILEEAKDKDDIYPDKMEK